MPVCIFSQQHCCLHGVYFQDHVLVTSWCFQGTGVRPKAPVTPALKATQPYGKISSCQWDQCDQRIQLWWPATPLCCLPACSQLASTLAVSSPACPVSSHYITSRNTNFITFAAQWRLVEACVHQILWSLVPTSGQCFHSVWGGLSNLLQIHINAHAIISRILKLELKQLVSQFLTL